MHTGPVCYPGAQVFTGLHVWERCVLLPDCDHLSQLCPTLVTSTRDEVVYIYLSLSLSHTTTVSKKVHTVCICFQFSEPGHTVCQEEGRERGHHL